ncbi:TPA: hypothetical protein ACGE3T_001249 [Acinetobacter baumannii]|nr:hypothetical protein BFR94_07485 [Acinetobacter pittii]PPB91384.1 hypothetical protein AbaMCR9238_06515 [Acinetobacter baumannii]PPC07338.1 hypothetical protein AbaMCR10126_17000 [Acinetobacter baumannii]PPC15878.1 hypothetical protein AbaMCR10172_10370 [Acinetobacter baumannii]
MVFLMWCCKTRNKVKILYGSLQAMGISLTESNTHQETVSFDTYSFEAVLMVFLLVVYQGN